MLDYFTQMRSVVAEDHFIFRFEQHMCLGKAEAALLKQVGCKSHIVLVHAQYHLRLLLRHGPLVESKLPRGPCSALSALSRPSAAPSNSALRRVP